MEAISEALAWKTTNASVIKVDTRRKSIFIAEERSLKVFIAPDYRGACMLWPQMNDEVVNLLSVFVDMRKRSCYTLVDKIRNTYREPVALITK